MLIFLIFEKYHFFLKFLCQKHRNNKNIFFSNFRKKIWKHTFFSYKNGKIGKMISEFSIFFILPLISPFSSSFFFFFNV